MLLACWHCYLHALCPHTRLDGEVIKGLAAPTDIAAIGGLVALTGIVVIIGTAGTTGMEIRIEHVSLSALDGDPGGGVRRRTPTIHTTRAIQRRRL